MNSTDKSPHLHAAPRAARRRDGALWLLAAAACATLPLACRARNSVAPGGATPAAGSSSTRQGAASDPLHGPLIVWWTEGEKERSAWIEPDGDGHRVVAERDGAVIATRDALWIARELAIGSRTLSPSCDCLLGSAPPGTDCSPVPADRRAKALVRIGDRRILRLESGDEDAAEGTETEHETTVTLEHSLGAWAVAAEHQYAYGCGAHGMYADVVHWIDLEHEKLVQPPAPPASSLPNLIAEAREQLAGEADGCALDPNEEPSFYASHIELGDEGAAHLSYEFTVPAAYVCGTGPGHYTISTRVDADQLPLAWMRFASPPAHLASFARAHPKSQLGGWGPVSASLLPRFRGEAD
jgi:hypothetical protein